MHELHEFIALFSYPFMQRAFLCGAVVGLLCPFVGMFVILRGLSFIGVGVSHAAFAGVAIGILLDLPPLLCAVVFCVLIAAGVGWISRRGRIKEDTSIGIMFAASMALGFLIMSVADAPGFSITSVLFGSIVGLSRGDLLFIFGFGLVVFGMVLLIYKELILIVFDEELAYFSGYPVVFLYYFFLVLLAVCVVLCVKVVGVVLMSALLITPAAAALQLTRRLDRAVLLAGVIGVCVTEAGLVVSYFTDLPPGALIALLATLVFVVSAGFSASQKRPPTEIT